MQISIRDESLGERAEGWKKTLNLIWLINKLTFTLKEMASFTICLKILRQQCFLTLNYQVVSTLHQSFGLIFFFFLNYCDTFVTGISEFDSSNNFPVCSHTPSKGLVPCFAAIWKQSDAFKLQSFWLLPLQ